MFDGATEVERIGKEDGRYELNYNLQEKYPAESVIALIRAAVSPDRWQPLERDWLNPENPSGPTRGWQEVIDGRKSPNKIVHVWNAHWRDDTGNVVHYSLSYESAVPTAENPDRTPDNRLLMVRGAFFPASVVEAMRKQLGITQPLH